MSDPTRARAFAVAKKTAVHQVEACHNVVGLPENVTAEINGSSSVETRRALWRSKRVFYATPQTVQNDLEKGVLDARRVVLLASPTGVFATRRNTHTRQVVEKKAIKQKSHRHARWWTKHIARRRSTRTAAWCV